MLTSPVLQARTLSLPMPLSMTAHRPASAAGTAPFFPAPSKQQLCSKTSDRLESGLLPKREIGILGILRMPLTLSIVDETTAGERCSAGAFEFDAPALTLRELIRVRIQQEVKRFNQTESQGFRGLVQPEESERILNGVRERPV